MSASRIAVAAALASALFWGVKAMAIGIAGGLDKSPLESPLFGLGLIAIVVAFVALGVSLASGRPTAQKVLGGIGGLLVGFILFLLVEGAMSAIVPDSSGWVSEEAGLWVASLLTVAVTVFWLRSRTHDSLRTSG